MNRRCRCSGCRFLSGIHLLLEVKKDVITWFRQAIAIRLQEGEFIFMFLVDKKHKHCLFPTRVIWGKKVPLTCHDVGITMGIPHNGRKLIFDKGTVKASPMSSLKDIEALMVDIDDIEEFKWVFLIFTCATLLAPISRLEGSHALWYTP